MTRFSTLLFIVLYSHLQAEYLDVTFKRVMGIQNKKSSSNVLWQTTGSRMSCLARCASDNQCLSCIHSDQSCSGHSVIFSLSSSMLSESGFRYYEIEGVYNKLGCVPVPSEHGYCLKLHTTRLNWTDQIAACQAENMQLASLTTEDRFQFARNYLLGIGHAEAVTVGASDLSGTWQWLSGDNVTMGTTYWGVGEPSGETGQDCLLMAYGIQYKFNDALCDTLKTFICEKYYISS